MKKITIILFLISLFSVICYGQDCSEYHKWADCRKSIRKNYDIYLQPKKATIGINDTLKYNVVFYGKGDYIISFCVDKLYYPINIKLLQLETGEELYNNAKDNYHDTFDVRFNKTQNLIIEVILLADKLGKDRITSMDKVCVGLLMQWKTNYYTK